MSAANILFKKHVPLAIPDTTSGALIVKVSWAGDYPLLPQEATKMLTISPYEEQYMFVASSDSTLSELSFNSASRELSFTATDETGTTGYVTVKIAKNLVTDIAELKVHSDGNELDYTLASTGGSCPSTRR